MALTGARLLGALGSVLGPCAVLGYGYLALRRVYGGAWWQLSWPVALLAAAYGSLILLALSVLALIALIG